MAATKEATTEDILAIALDINKRPDQILGELADMLFNCEDEISRGLRSYLILKRGFSSLCRILLENRLENNFEGDINYSDIVFDYLAVIMAFESGPKAVNYMVNDLRNGEIKSYLHKKALSILTQRQEKQEEAERKDETAASNSSVPAVSAPFDHGQSSSSVISVSVPPQSLMGDAKKSNPSLFFAPPPAPLFNNGDALMDELTQYLISNEEEFRNWSADITVQNKCKVVEKLINYIQTGKADSVQFTEEETAACNDDSGLKALVDKAKELFSVSKGYSKN